MSYKLYSLEKLKAIDDSDDFIRQMIDTFITNARELSHDLDAAAASHDWKKVYYVAHRLKSNIDLVDIVCIQQDIRTVEEMAKANRCSPATAEKVKYIYHIISECTLQMHTDFFA